MKTTKAECHQLSWCNATTPPGVPVTSQERGKMMERAELNYILSECRYAVDYLHNKSQTATSKEECNRAFNFSMFVNQLVIKAQTLFDQNLSLKQQIVESERTIQNLKSGEFNELIEKERAKLQQEFESLRNALTQVILDFPDIDY